MDLYHYTIWNFNTVDVVEKVHTYVLVDSIVDKLMIILDIHVYWINFTWNIIILLSMSSTF